MEKMTYKTDFILESAGFYKSIIQKIREFKLSKNKEGISHQNIVSYATYSPWIDDKNFQEAYELFKGYTLVDVYRCYELWHYISKNQKLIGDIVEIGVWKGGTGSILAKANQQFQNSETYLIDTFTGVVKASEKDTLYKGGEHSDTSFEFVKDLIETNNLKNVHLLAGVFPDEVIPKYPFLLDIQVKLCHIDVDTYLSAKQSFFQIWPNVVKGGVVIFDDYGFWGCEGITEFVNEIDLSDATVIYNLNGHALVIKK